MRIATLATGCALLLLCTSAVDAGPFSRGRSDNDFPLQAQGPPDWAQGPPDWAPGPPEWAPGPPPWTPGPPGDDSPVFANPEPSSIALGLVGSVTLAAGALRRRRGRTSR